MIVELNVTQNVQLEENENRRFDHYRGRGLPPHKAYNPASKFQPKVRRPTMLMQVAQWDSGFMQQFGDMQRSMEQMFGAMNGTD